MSKKQFVHLHVHSQYSLLDGAVKIVPALEKCEEEGMPALAITDHGTMAGLVDFYSTAKEYNIKPILGVEVYVVPDHELRERQTMNHLTLLARNNNGYKNLLKLVSESNFKGFYYKPRISLSLLAKYSDDIIILTGCNQGTVYKNLAAGQVDSAVDFISKLSEWAPVYVEIQNHGLEDQARALNQIKFLPEWVQNILVATNDVHYLEQDDAKYHDALLAINTRTSLYDPARFKFDSEELYLKTRQEMGMNFAPFLTKETIVKSLDNSISIANMCNVELELGSLHFPQYNTKKTPEIKLDELVKSNILKRDIVYGDIYKERIDRELGVINRMGFASYFLILHDFVKYCKDNDIITGPGRGSVVGSIIAYILGITAVDPIEHGLLFERFLNESRFSPPDIDLDVSQRDRQKVFKYLEETYGRKNVAQILTFGKIGAKAAIKDSARITGEIPYEESNNLTKLILFGSTLSESLASDYSLQAAKELYPETFDIALGVEGSLRHKSIHAAGVVIGDKPLTEYVPLEIKNGQAVCEADMYTIEKLGLLKIDILGLRNLDIVKDTINLIKEQTGKEIDTESIPLDDFKTYALLNDGSTFGVFQLETPGITETLLKVKPDDIEGIADVIALYRPGPKEWIPTYVENKRLGVGTSDEKLQKILSQTYYIAVYQEQLMEISKECAGFSLNDADILRKAIGKKDPKLLKTLKNQFYKGCKKSGYAKDATDRLWDLMEKAGNYAFNKSHALGYAILAYWEAYLKFNYPIQFYASLLNHAKDENIMKYMLAINSDLEVLPIDINKSLNNFSVDKDKLRLGFNCVKYVGGKLGEKIERGKEVAPYMSLMDFCSSINPNLNALKALISVGAFDSLYPHTTRAILLDKCKEILTESRRAKTRKKSQEPKEIKIDPDLSDELKENIEQEIKYTGFSMSLLKDIPKAKINDFKSSSIKSADVEAVIISLKEHKTKAGESMAFVTLLDSDGEHDAVSFPKQYSKIKKKLHKSIMKKASLNISKINSAAYGMTLIINKLEA